MLALLSVAGLVAVAAITPGPNNFVVMHVAARAGIVRALPVIAMIVLGSIVLLTLATTGAGTVLEARPALARALTIAGCLYLSWMGISLLLARDQACLLYTSDAG
ncbi:LysE family translocator, partial [Steroidobacter cummioxidans]|uniref:LysE family translocator n=1 Tax=Steroidobacter cummioxidans TaxID=1803913 RepID=UPI00137A04CF